MPFFTHDRLRFHYYELGSGVPFVFQHGLGADLEQPMALLPPPTGCQLIAFDCRAHGRTDPIGPMEKISLRSFASDLRALLDHLGIERAVVGGISMGAAVALRFARHSKSRLLGLVQCRPAWWVGPNRENAAIFSAIASLLRELGPERGQQEFQRSDIYRTIAAESPDAAASLCSQFQKSQAVARAIRLERIPLDSAVDSLEDLHALDVPTIVLANRHDPIHRFAFGEAIASAIPGAVFEEITAKSICPQTHVADVRRCLTKFVQRHFL